MRILDGDTQHAPLSDLTPHPENPRQGDIGAIHESINENGFYGVVVAQRSTGHILVGNHRYQAAKAAGAESIPVQWVDVDDEHALRILLADNRTNDLATYDDNALAQLLTTLHDDTENGLSGTGYDGDDLDELLHDLDDAPPGARENGYTQKIESPIYEPSGPPDPVHDLTSREKADELRAEIDETPDLPDDVRAFLHAAAERHTVFHFARIANYYAHAPEHVQHLMERSALVIIDFDKAIENGFVRLNDETRAAFQTDHPDA